MSPTIGRLAAVTILLLAVGCARSDWIESTLVTADVTGDWRGEWTQPHFAGAMRLILKQEGSRITGDLVSFTGALDANYVGRVEGTINGDVVALTSARLRMELTVNGDELSGEGSRASGHLLIKLRR
jgi:hypothetical protein